MKILFISAADSTHTARWVNALAERGHEIHLVSNKNHAPKTDNITEKVQLHLLKYTGMLGYYLNAFELKKLTENINPDVINVHYASGYGTLARIAGIKPVLLSVWGSDVYEFPFQSKYKERILNKNLLYAQKIAATSHCMAEQVKKLLKDEKKQVAITPFGIDSNKFVPSNVKSEKAEIIIGNVKSLKQVYGISDLIKAFRLLYEKLKDENKNEIADLLRLEIYGEGEEKEELEQLIKRLEFQEKVSLKGKVANNDVPRILSNMDIFCATSLRESFGVAILEAMSSGLPVVVTDTVGFKEVVGQAGIIVETGNIEQIAEALKSLVLNQQLRTEYGKKGRKRVQELYDWNENVSEMEALYKEYQN